VAVQLFAEGYGVDDVILCRCVYHGFENDSMGFGKEIPTVDGGLDRWKRAIVEQDAAKQGSLSVEVRQLQFRVA
jgi:hypothetical protein